MLRLLTTLALTLALTGVNAGTSDHFVLTTAGTLGIMRMDPIVNPGGVSGHLHTIMGGSLFGANLGEPGELTKSDCSSVIIGDDKSNYWAPSLMYKFENGSFSHILHSTRIYYFLKTEEVKPFPPGLRMITGNAAFRNATDWKAKGVMWSCNHGKQGKELPTQTGAGPCTSIQAGIFFPSCGLADGSLDSDNHFDHMTWPIDSPAGSTPNGHNCPDTHPIKYPTIFMEISYYLTPEQKWRNDLDMLVLANGDAVGSSYHADFHNGWVPETLQATIDQCGVGHSVGDALETCPPLKKSYQEDKGLNCRLQGDIIDEDVGLYRPLDKLPGCNTLWTSRMSDEKPKCVEAVKPGFVKPSLFYNNLRYWLSIPIIAPAGVEEDNAEDSGILSDRPSLGLVGASTLRKWIWGDNTVLAPATDSAASDAVPIVNVSSIASASTSRPSSPAPSASANPDLVNNVAFVEEPEPVASSYTTEASVSSTSTPVASAPSKPLVNNVAAVGAPEPELSSVSHQSAASSGTAASATLSAATVKKPKTCSKRRKRNGLAQRRKRSSLGRH